MSSSTSEPLSVIISLQVQAYCIAATTALVAYDHLCNFLRETQLIWGRGLNSITLLYHVNRWTTAVYVVLAWFPGTTVASCNALFYLSDSLSLVLYTVVAVFSAIRVYALSHGRWWIACLVCTLGLVPVCTNAYGIASTFYVADPAGGCDEVTKVSLENSDRFVISTRAAVLASDAVVLMVTWVTSFNLRRAALRTTIRLPLQTLLLRDGTLYFLLMFALNVLQVIGNLTGTFNFAVNSFYVPVVSVLISHFLLNLRQVANASDGNLQGTSTTTMRSQTSTMRFASFVDNMGELLDNGLEPDGESDGAEAEVNDVCQYGDRRSDDGDISIRRL